MKIYVDFDRTLFDCDRFLENMFALIYRYNVNKEMFKEYQNQCKRKGFNPYIILDLIKEKSSFDEKLYNEIDNLMMRSSEYLYQDAKKFLEYLKSLDYQVVILTRGNSHYQREKIFNSHLDLCYNKLVVTMKHKGNLNLDYENSIFIDDNPREIQSILLRKPKMVIRMQREKSKYSDVPFEILTVKSLEEIIDKKIL